MDTLLPDIRELANRQPFRPFVIRTSNGDAYPVMEPFAIGGNDRVLHVFGATVNRILPEHVVSVEESS